MTGRVQELDGLRGVAIAMVLVFHCTRVPTMLPSVAGLAQRVTWSGWAGVDVFFVLSGFLVGGILLSGRDDQGTLKRFFIRRGMRILPLYFVVLLTAWLIPLVTIGFQRWPFAESLPWWSYATLTQNFARPLLHTDSGYLGHTWSLALELQVYLVAGLVLLYAPLPRIKLILVAGIVISITCRIAACALGNGEFGYFALPARLDAACLGALASIVVNDKRALGWISTRRAALWTTAGILSAGAVALIAAGQGIGSWGSAIYNHAAFAISTTITIVLLIENKDGLANRILKMSWLVGLGSISYAVYLLHMPVVSLSNLAFGNSSMHVDNTAGIFGTIIGLMATLLLSKISWRFFEKRLIDQSHVWTRRPAS
jgi:peptidoglycan/LPS O-acetylase OafA/YrhL